MQNKKKTFVHIVGSENLQSVIPKTRQDVKRSVDLYFKYFLHFVAIHHRILNL